MNGIRSLVVGLALVGCSASPDDAAPSDQALAVDTLDALPTSKPDGGADAASGVTSSPPIGTACEYGFFRKYFDRDNAPGLESLREESFLRIVEKTKSLQACGAKISLGGILSLMIYEGSGAKIAFFNDRCAENSYDKSRTCWTNPKARYSYQYGLAPVHTSNFHPCADVAYTSKMRARLEKAITAAGFEASSSEIASVDAEVKTFCPSATATLVDYYILTAHSKFSVPTDGAGNDQKNAGTYPFFTPRVVIDLFFNVIDGNCSALTSDNAAISIFAGGDPSYKTASKQATILKLWNDYQAATCP